MASGQDMCRFSAADGRQPAADFATFDTRNGHTVADFPGTGADKELMFEDVMPANYGGGGVNVIVVYTFSSATSGNVRWQTAFERIGIAQQDIDSDGFASFNSGGGTAPGTSGHTASTTIAHTNGAQMDSVAAGEAFRLKVRRDQDGTSGTDDITTDAELKHVIIREI